MGVKETIIARVDMITGGRTSFTANRVARSGLTCQDPLVILMCTCKSFDANTLACSKPPTSHPRELLRENSGVIHHYPIKSKSKSRLNYCLRLECSWRGLWSYVHDIVLTIVIHFTFIAAHNCIQLNIPLCRIQFF